MHDKINPLEEIFITFRAYYDAKHNIFSTIKYKPEPNPDLSLKDSGHSDEEEKDILSSPYINSQLSKYEAKRAYFFGKRRFLYWTYLLPRLKLVQYSKFSDAMEDIDTQIIELDVQLNMLRTGHKRQKDLLVKKREQYKKDHLRHMEVLCENQIDECASAYDRDFKRLYGNMIILMGQKRKILTSADKQLTFMRDRRFLRIRTYYEKVITYTDRLPVIYMTDEGLQKIADTSTLPYPDMIEFARITNILRDTDSDMKNRY